MYLGRDDLEVVMSWLNQERAIAFIVADGARRWKAVDAVADPDDGRYCLWHIESGPLPLLREADQPLVVNDPWAGWKGLRTGVDATAPYFGPGAPNIFWLEARADPWTSGRVPPGKLGPPADTGLRSIQESYHYSSFHWIGRRYREPPPEATKWWARLRRWIKKQSVRIPTDGDNVYALPQAKSRFDAEVEAWRDLWCNLERYCLVAYAVGGDEFHIVDRSTEKYVCVEHVAVSDVVIERMRESGAEIRMPPT